MSQEIKRAESLLETVKGQCREAKARADRKNQTIVNNYLDSARGNVELISRIVQARQDSGDQDSRDFRVLKICLAQAEDTYDVAAIYVAQKFGLLKGR